MTYTLTENDFQLYSDMHKDAYGFRPRIRPEYETEACFMKDIDVLQDEIIRSIRREHDMEAAAFLVWKQRVKRDAKLDGVTIKEYIKQDMERVDAWDFDGYLYEMGIGCGKLARRVAKATGFQLTY